MVKVLFICHGNICRSPMAEFLFKDFVQKKGRQNDFYIESCATSSEEIGNPVHYGTRTKLQSLGISVKGKFARKMTYKDYEKFDYLICMDSNNLRNICRIIGNDEQQKVYRLLDFSDFPRDIKDPWYTGNFDETYDDIMEGINAFWENEILKS